MDKAAIYNQLVNTPTNGVNGIDLGQLGLSEGRPSPVVQGEDGQMYPANEYLDSDGNWQTNPDFTTPVYYFHQPLEAGDARGNYAEYSDDLQSADQQGYWRTEEEIKAYWDGEGATDMNMFQQTNPDMDFGTYMSFIKENSALHAQGVTPESDPDAFAGITEKYGIQTSTTDNDNVYGWNGSNYTKTFKPEDPNYGRMLWGAALGAMGGQALGGYLSGLAGPALPAGVAGPSAPLLSSGVSNALAAGATNAAGQGLLTGSIDPASVLSSAVMAGINPGGYVADNYAPWMPNGELQFGGAPPSSFYGGLVSGAVNDVVKTAIVDGEVDLQNSLEKGLISGGINSLTNTYEEFKNNSQEAIADKLQYGDPYKYPNTEAGRALAMKDALSDPLLNTTDMGALIGDGGLLRFIPRADLTGIRNIVDTVGDGVDGVLYGFDIGDKQTIGLLNNPVVNGLADGLGAILPEGDDDGQTTLSDDIQAQVDQFGGEWYTQNPTNELNQYGASGDGVTLYGPDGSLTSAGVAAKWDFINTKMDTLGSFNYDLSGGLNEDYSWAANPRGDSELWGTLTNIPGLFSTGSVNNGTAIQPPRNKDGDVVKPLSLAGGVVIPPEIDAVNTGEVVLPSNNDNAIRSQNILDYLDLLNGGLAGGGSSSEVDFSEVGADTIEDTVSTSSDADATKDTASTSSTASTGNDIDVATVETPGNTTNTTSVDSVTNEVTVPPEIKVPSSTTLSGGSGGTPITGNSGKGLPVLWGELDPYTKFRGYAKKRQDLYNKMMKAFESKELKGMLSGGISSLTPRERELFEAGEFKR